MTTAEVEVQQRTAPVAWRAAPRFLPHIRFTPGERRFLLVFVDLLLANASLLAAVVIWNNVTPSLAAVLDASKWFVTLSCVWIGCHILFDTYNLPRAGSLTSTMISVGPAAALAALIYLGIPWLTPSVDSRSYVFGFVALSVSSGLGWRMFYAVALAQPAFYRRALVLGTGDKAQMLVRDLNQVAQAGNANPFRGTGYQVVGVVSHQPGVESDHCQELPICGELAELPHMARSFAVDEIIVALETEDLQCPEIYEALLSCRELGLPVSPLSNIYERLTARLPVDYAGRDLQVLLGPADSPANRFYVSTKRLLDFLLALVALLPLGLLAPFVALANAIWSPGPLFYRQQRVGQAGRLFGMYKFRSMIVNAEQFTGAVWSTDRDPRITPAGALLRRSRLDELPQVLNVLAGHMSMVGPRPERPPFVDMLSNQLPLYRARNAVAPGITGWAQIRYHYGNSVEDSRVKLEYDLYYVKHASLYLDLLILLQTLPAMIQLRGK